LHAARIVRDSHKVPDAPENGEAKRRRRLPGFVDANLRADFTPPAVLGGYRRRGCQVAEKPCPTGPNAAFRLSWGGRRNSGSRYQNTRSKAP